ncbi:DUF3833 domain-containing protein [Gammaproteobacteria bacterium]|nr:DUF3833 domain-containing protein [Gammaproteobacteria bacterium]
MQNRFGILLVIAISLSALTGCMTMKSSNFTDESPKFVLENYFNGKTKAWGIFEDRFGNVKRQFTVDIDGLWDGKTLTLDEHFLFNDGEKSYRQWRITKKEDGVYEGKADDVIGSATGVSAGNSLHWSYLLDLKMDDNKTLRVKFDDWMFLQPGGVVLNRARMSKFGVELGQVTISFSKMDGFAKPSLTKDSQFDDENIAALAQK